MIFLALINIFRIRPSVVFKGTNILLWYVHAVTVMSFVHAVIENDGIEHVQEFFPHIS